MIIFNSVNFIKTIQSALKKEVINKSINQFITILDIYTLSQPETIIMQAQIWLQRYKIWFVIRNFSGRYFRQRVLFLNFSLIKNNFPDNIFQYEKK